MIRNEIIFNELSLLGDRDFTELAPQSPRLGGGAARGQPKAGGGNGPGRGCVGDRVGHLASSPGDRRMLPVVRAG
mgnify:FL=1